ncbi:MAG: type I-E CRISPR-associated protein Cse1/CasA [Gemmatimonadaceae bacterium]
MSRGNTHSREDDVTERLYDLREEPWIPFRRRSGVVQWGAPWLLTDQLHSDPIVALAAPRPDFNGALHEFLIGLVSVAMRAQDEEEWQEWWKRPPAPELLRERLMALPSAFYLNGDGPRFMQDLRVEDFAKAEPLPIERMLIDAPGEQSLDLNKDVFVKRERVRVMGAPAATMALLTLQTYSPAGGRGNLTSLRGGGPLTTLIVPAPSSEATNVNSLWAIVWANAETEEQWLSRAVAKSSWKAAELFPWLAAPTTSEGGKTVSLADAHPMQCYFGVPRRVRLSFGAEDTCDIVGEVSVLSVTSFQMRPYGAKYESWTHPLSPYYRASKGDAWLPVHGQPGGVGWKDWLALTLADASAVDRRPAQSVAHFRIRRARHDASTLLRLRAFGYDMDNMKARDWVDATLPCPAPDDEHTLQLLRDTSTRLVSGTQLASGLLAGAVERALFPNPKEAPGDRAPVKAALWGEMEQPFYQVIVDVVARGASVADIDAACAAFRASLETAVLDGFDTHVSRVQLLSSHVRRAVAARYGLLAALRGYGKMGNKLFTELRLPVPESAAPRAKEARGGKKQRTRTGGKAT